MKRVFIAIKTDAGGEIIKIISSLKILLATEKIKWVDTSNIHLTLAFLGDTEEKRIRLLKAMLKDKCAGIQEFEIVLSGMGVFKTYRDPKVIWAGIMPSAGLSELNNSITAGLKENDFKIEDRPFRPHLTIGRIRSIKDTDNLKNVLEKYRETEFQTVSVREVILFESILMQTGPMYKQLESYHLK